MHLRVLESETFEGIKLGVHGLALGLSALMCAYNAAAWLQRRQRHLAVNTLVYAGAIVLEQQHVAHHWRTLRRLDRVTTPSPVPKPIPAPSEPRRAA
jgi:phage terminase large subunit GpA-like protein